MAWYTTMSVTCRLPHVKQDSWSQKRTTESVVCWMISFISQSKTKRITPCQWQRTQALKVCRISQNAPYFRANNSLLDQAKIWVGLVARCSWALQAPMSAICRVRSLLTLREWDERLERVLCEIWLKCFLFVTVFVIFIANQTLLDRFPMLNLHFSLC